MPLDPAALSRDPAVGEAYAADPLVYHGPFRRETLQAFKDVTATIAGGPALGALPTLWPHGEHDPLAPLDATAAAFEHVGGSRWSDASTRARCTRSSTRPTRTRSSPTWSGS